jgi:hypothetical protein
VAVNGSYSNSCFYPSPSLGFNTTYTMTIGTGVQDNNGNGLTAPYSFSFTTALATPTGLTATAGTLRTDLTWSPVSGATSYTIYWSNSAGVTKTNSIKITTGSTATTYSHTNLANGSTYVYRVAAVVGSSESDLSNEVKVSFDTSPPVVSSTSNDTYRVSSYLTANFNEPIDTSTITSNTIQVMRNGVTVPGHSYNYTGDAYVGWAGDSDFNYSTTYTATVSGVKDPAGNLMTPYSWTFTTVSLGVPNVTASAGGSGSHQITLNWPTVSGATTYSVYWATTPGVTIANGTKIEGAMPPFTHTGLTAGTTYYYVVSAISGPSEGGASMQVSAVAP